MILDETVFDPISHKRMSKTEDAFAVGAELGDKFRVERQLGSGAMGHVLLATDKSLGRKVAIKVVISEVHEDMLRREAIAMARVRHENVVQIHALDVHEGRP